MAFPWSDTSVPFRPAKTPAPSLYHQTSLVGGAAVDSAREVRLARTHLSCATSGARRAARCLLRLRLAILTPSRARVFTARTHTRIAAHP